MCDNPRISRAKRTVDAADDDCNVSDDDVGGYLAQAFCDKYLPAPPPPDHTREAAEAIQDTLYNSIPGCLTKAQIQDEDVQALVFAVTAAKHGWIKR